MITELLLASLLRTLPTPTIAKNLPALPNAPAITLTANPLPIKKEHASTPVVKARAVMIIEPKSGTILHKKNANEKLPIASLTKLMTAVIVAEEENLNRVITVPKIATEVPGTKIWLNAGERMKVGDLLAGALIASGNDAATALAHENAGTVERFVQKMNEKARLLGMYSTQFKNPTGLDDPNAYSTAADLSLLTLYALKKPEILVLADKMELTIGGDGQRTRVLKNTNQLLGTSLFHIKGLKTGSTKAAGTCLITVAENEKGNQVAIIVLGSPARFRESKLLVNWAFQNYIW